MSFLGIRFDKHTLGNLVKNIAPAAGVALGGPAGLALAGGLGALGEAGRGHTKFSQLAKAGLSNAAIAGAGEGVAGHFGFHGVGGLGSVGSPAAASTGSPAAVAPTVTAPAGVAADGEAGLAPEVTGMAPPTPPGGLTSRLGGVLNFAESHPNAASGVLQGVGGLASSGSENRLRNAQASNLEAQAGMTQYDLDQLKRRQAQYAPVFSSLAQGPTTGGYANVAKNPYLVGA